MPLGAPEHSLRSLGLSLATGAVVFASVFVGACSSTPEKPKTEESAASDEPKKLEHEKCDKSMGRVQDLDTDKDGKPELLQVFNSNNKELCRAVDFNHDGKPDMYEYYNEDGTLRRREGAYEQHLDAISEISVFEEGKLVKRERDTLGLRKIDTWDTYDPATGKLVKRERATKGNGKIDQWWTWEGDHITIAVDKNGDGQPDPDATITVGLNGEPYVPPEKRKKQQDSDAGAEGNILPPPNPPVLWPAGTPVDTGKKADKKPSKGQKPK